uniref:Uncharacterized protein n=1 Tax=Chlorobium chlorochromatii (strain CaD3) TaxID=340177 RepID=Q3ASS0_CHLCH
MNDGIVIPTSQFSIINKNPTHSTHPLIAKNLVQDKRQPQGLPLHFYNSPPLEGCPKGGVVFRANSNCGQKGLPQRAAPYFPLSTQYFSTPPFSINVIRYKKRLRVRVIRGIRGEWFVRGLFGVARVHHNTQHYPFYTSYVYKQYNERLYSHCFCGLHENCYGIRS